jgi:hypothetical protein
MQPLATVTITRPWHWGIVIVSDAELGGQIPDVDPDAPVTANENGLVILVRHAQDVPSFDGDFEWAETTVALCHRATSPSPNPERTQLFEGTLATPSGRLWIGDADDEVVTSGLSTSSILRISAPLDEVDSPGQIWIDTWSDGGTESGG